MVFLVSNGLRVKTYGGYLRDASEFQDAAQTAPSGFPPAYKLEVLSDTFPGLLEQAIKSLDSFVYYFRVQNWSRTGPIGFGSKFRAKPR